MGEENDVKYVAGSQSYSNEKDFFSFDEHLQRREKAISDHIDFMVSNYKNREKTKRAFQIIISVALLISMIAFAILLAYVIIYSTQNELSNAGIITSILSTAGGFVSSLIGVFAVIVKYIFPKGEDNTSMDILKLAIDMDQFYIQHRQAMSAGEDNVCEE